MPKPQITLSYNSRPCIPARDSDLTSFDPSVPLKTGEILKSIDFKIISAIVQVQINLKLDFIFMETAKKIFRLFLKDQGLQLTGQRELIIDEFLQTTSHVSVEEFYEQVKKREPSIGQVTIFRTLKLLVEAEIARPVNFGDKTIRYERSHGKKHHDHLVCLVCGTIIEVFDQELERIQDALCATYNFTPTNHRLEIFGTCPKCR